MLGPNDSLRMRLTPGFSVGRITCVGVPSKRRREISKRFSMRNPSISTQGLCLGVCFLHAHRSGEAKVALTACLGQQPRFAWSYLFLAAACAPSATARMLFALEQALDLESSDLAHYAVLTRLGFLQYQMNRLKEARLTFAKATELRPNESVGWAGLAQIDARERKWDWAVRHFGTAVLQQSMALERTN